MLTGDSKIYFFLDSIYPEVEDYEAHMSLPQPIKFVLDNFIATALSATPSKLHPYFESFRSLYMRKCVFYFF